MERLTDMILHGRYHVEGSEDARWRNPRSGKAMCNSWGPTPCTTHRWRRDAVGGRRSCPGVRTRPDQPAGVGSGGGSRSTR